jgi:flavodoxin/NAD-dependent dihydropyrimidine dehydrogenase PreA subunit
MNSIVIYFSMTGNTKKVAEAIHGGMKQSSRENERCDITRLRDIGPRELAAYDLIGLGSPVIRQRELLNVTNFIQNTMKNVDGKHGFAFCTHGALPGNYLARVVPAMVQRGMTIIGWNNWFGNCYHPALPKPYFTDGHPDAVDLQEAQDFGKEMLELSRKIYSGETGLIPEFPRGKEYDDIYFPSPPPPKEVLDKFYRAQADILLKVNPDKCRYPECTFCIVKCPLNSIDFSGSSPTFNINCDKCWLCEQACPYGAIEVDWRAFHQAHLKMMDALEKSLEVFEARGKFRRLVPKEQVGTDNYVWQHKQPRFKVV